MLSAPSQAHFTSRPDVLVGTPGFLCPDNHTDSYTLVKMDLAVAFGVIPKAISGRNGHMVRECQWRWASRPTSCWRWCRRSKLDFTQNPGKVMDDITFVRSHWWLVSEGFSLSTANSDVQKLPATLYHSIADSLAYAA